MTSPTHITPTELPDTIRRYLAAHAARDVDTAIQAFSADAVVVDEGHTFRGTNEVRDFLQNAGGEFSYTTELVDVTRVDDERWTVTVHLEGNFPGGVVDLTYRLTMAGDHITELITAATDSS